MRERLRDLRETIESIEHIDLLDRLELKLDSIASILKHVYDGLPAELRSKPVPLDRLLAYLSSKGYPSGEVAVVASGVLEAARLKEYNWRDAIVDLNTRRELYRGLYALYESLADDLEDEEGEHEAS